MLESGTQSDFNTVQAVYSIGHSLSEMMTYLCSNISQSICLKNIERYTNLKVINCKQIIVSK